jgi:signal transduction histidine kinase
MNAAFDHVLARGGHTGALIASLDWSAHTLGPIDTWPVALKNALSLCLVSKTPSLVRWGANPSDLIEFYNDAYRPVLGPNRHPRAMGALAKEVWPEVWHSIRKTFDSVLSAGEASDHKDSFMFLDRNGFQEEAYFDHAHSPLYADEGRVVGVFSIIKETTARVLSERRLRTLKELAEHAARARTLSSAGRQYASLLTTNAADVPFCMVVGADDASRELLGCAGLTEQTARAARERLPLTQVLHSNELLVVDCQIESLPSEQAQREGRKAPQRACILPVRSHPDEPPCALLIVGLNPHLSFDESYRDFLELASNLLATALANASECQARPEQRTATGSGSIADPLLTAAGTILREAPVAIALLRGPDFVFELANQRCERMLGHASLTGKRVGDVLAAQRAPVLRALAHVRKTGEIFRENEFPVSRRLENGETQPAFFMFTCQPLHEGPPPVDWIVAVAIEVTEQVELRREIENMSREREQLLEQEQDARAGAEAANRVKDEFLAVLGHELRNPLAPITTALALMRQKAPLDHEALIIERQVGHLRRLVEDLLDVSRITRGKVELKRKPLNLATVVREAVELASPLLEERQQHLSLDLPATGLDVLGDRTRIAQVLANLLTNASKYSGRATLISVRGCRLPEEKVVEISVRDRGIGIEPEMLPSVWNAFTQGAQAIDRSHGGLGLGLTIVRSLVELHGGSVAVYSAGKGQGSEFCVRLPLMATEWIEAPEPRARPSQTHGGVFAAYKVLLVDDNEDAVELLAEWFRVRGAVVETALDGLSALEVAKRFEPHVALLDLGLPAMNGYEVARRLRAQESARELLLIAVTGYGEQSARQMTREAGFDDHCVKPLDLTQFEEKLREKLALR